jgi:hypothetical protein
MADEEALQGAIQGRLRGPEWSMMPRGARRAAADEGPTARVWKAVASPGHPIGVLAVAGEAVSLGAGTDEAAHQVAARQA